MSWYDLDDLFSRVELPDVARQLGMDVERRGANLITSCPFHEDTQPSLVLYPHDAGNQSHFHCFSCNTHGFATDLVMKVQGVEFKPAIEWLAHNLGITPKRISSARQEPTKSTREDALSFALKVFDQSHDETAFIEWCHLRQFNRDFVYNLGLRCLPIGSILVKALHLENFGRQQELIDGLLSAGLLIRLRPATKTNAQESLDLSEQFKDYFHDGRLLIPIHSIKNKLVGFAGRYRLHPNLNSNTRSEPAKYLLTPGFHKAEILFNANRARQTLNNALQDDTISADVYVVEGFLDALRLQSLNFPAVAIMGTGLSDDQRKGLIALTDLANVPGSKHVTLRVFFDRDSAGFDGASRAARQLLGLPGVAIEWIGFGERDKALLGKDPDEILKSLSHEEASSILNSHALPILGILIAASLGYKDSTPLSNERWDSISRYPRERALLQAIRALRILSNTTSDWVQRFQELPTPYPRWITDLLEVLLPKQQGGSVALRPGVLDLNFLVELEARLNHARMLAEHGARRGELPCDEETWRALDRNAQLFNTLALYRLEQQTWHQVAPCDTVHLPRKLTNDKEVLSDPRRKVMPHAADLHLQQFLMNELLTERHDFSHEGPRNFSDCIPAVRWFATEGEVRVTGHVNEGDPSPTLHDHERRIHDEPVLSFAYQIDMEVLEGRRKPSDQGMFRPYIDCWRGFMESLKRQANAIGPYVHVLRLDAKRYYDSIQQYIVRDRLLGPIEQALTISGTGDISTLLNPETNDPKKNAKRIVDLLCDNLFKHQYKDPDGGQDHYSAEGIGIPQGPVISAWIGTIAMFPVDAAARTFMRQTDQGQPGEPAKPRVGYARYVDDIVLLADSETNLNALREVVQAAASRLELTLVRKGEAVAPGSPEFVMSSLNNGRAMAPSAPAWEPPMVGDGETGWGMDDVDSIDRQSSLHLLRHPSLLDDHNTVHEKVRDALQAPDLRPSDLGKCARAIWWQIAMQALSKPSLRNSSNWEILWQAYLQRWNEITTDHKWAPAFSRRGYDILYSVEGLDMLIDSSSTIEKGRTQQWINKHRRALNNLARALLETSDVLQHKKLFHNSAHIQSRLRKVQWKALQRRPSDTANLYIETHQSTERTPTDWLCQAAILLHRYGMLHTSQAHPLETLLPLSDLQEAYCPDDIYATCQYLKPSALFDADTTHIYTNSEQIALLFLVANTTEKCRWRVLSIYPKTLTKDLPTKSNLEILAPLPVKGAGMIAYTRLDDTFDIRLVAFRGKTDDLPPELLPGAKLFNGRAHPVEDTMLSWSASEELTPGLYRYLSEQSFKLEFNSLQPNNRTRFAAELFEVLHSIQLQYAGDGKEWVIVMAHLAHESVAGKVIEVGMYKWFLVAEPIASSHLGVSAWVRDGRGGLRSISVPSGEYTRLWRIGCAVSDAIHMAFDLPVEDDSDSTEERDDALEHPSQIESYILTQQLGKLRGKWIADAQVRDQSNTGLPGTVRRSLDILRRFDPKLPSAKQVALVLHTEAETCSMTMRLRRKGPSDLRDRLHLLPSNVLQRLPLSVLEQLPLPHNQDKKFLRTDLSLLLALANVLSIEIKDLNSTFDAIDIEPGTAQALHIGIAMAATSTMLRGLAASVWGIARHRSPIACPEILRIPAGWIQPDTSQVDHQGEYSSMRSALIKDNWSKFKEATPWQWMLILLGILDSVAPKALDVSDKLHDVYEHLRQWQSAPIDEPGQQRWTWPYDDMPTYCTDTWCLLLQMLPDVARQVDQYLGVTVRQIEAPIFRRQRESSNFTDAESEQWVLAKLQYTGLGLTDSVARVERGGKRLATWSEVRRLSDNELLSVHTLDDKLGRWWDLNRMPISVSVNSLTDISANNTAKVQIEAAVDVSFEASVDIPAETPADVLVEAPADVPFEAPTDVPVETSADVPVEAPVDVPVEAPVDVPVEAPVDVPVEAPVDVPVEAPADVPGETSADVPVEAPADVPVETSADVPVETSADVPVETSVDVPVETSADVPVEAPADVPGETSADVPGEAPADVLVETTVNTQTEKLNASYSLGDIRASQYDSWRDRGKLKSKSHMRVALFQWQIDESYSHPLAEVSLNGMGLSERARAELKKAIPVDSAMAKADKAGARGKEYMWNDAYPESVPSWPEHRRRNLLKRALDACKQLKVDLLVLPEVSLRRDTIDWLEAELSHHYLGIAVLAGTYRHFGQLTSDVGRNIHPLMAPLTLLWSPEKELSEYLFTDSNIPSKTLRFWRGKKYRAVAANELFYPDWNQLDPLFRIEPLLNQLGNLTALSQAKHNALVLALCQKLPPLRYCMELICSELFLLTSPANAEPLRQEVAAMLRRFSGGPSDTAKSIVDKDREVVGSALSVLQEHSTPRRSVLLVPAATKRSNDYWHAGQASVLASGTATVFCNAAKSAISCGGSCFIGIESATRPHHESAGIIENLTPYHGWRKGILTARMDGALSEADQALVVVDIDPVHVVTGKPRPQLLPEPMVLVAYLPIIELLNTKANSAAIYQSLLTVDPPQIDPNANAAEVLAALGQVATSHLHAKTYEISEWWEAFHNLRKAKEIDGVELDKLVKMFRDPKAIRERLLTWLRDRHQQPHPTYRPLNREPAWLDFLDVDHTLKEGQALPRIVVPPWSTETGSAHDDAPDSNVT